MKWVRMFVQQPQGLSAENQFLETALLWLRADVYGDLAAAEQLIAEENVAMYGTVGRGEALRFKRQWLPQVRLHCV